MRRVVIITLSIALAPLAAIAELPIFDAHIHYSHDTREALPVKTAIEILRKAGVRWALVSSSDDDGTQALYKEAPDLIIPELRPYRVRSDLGTWTRDRFIIPYVEDRLSRYRYVAIGEFHVFGSDAELPIVRHMVQLSELPQDVAERIAWRNGEALFAPLAAALRKP